MNYLFAAYSAIWLIIFLYVFNVAKRQGKIEKEVSYLKAIVNQRES